MPVVDTYVNPNAISGSASVSQFEDGIFVGGKKVKAQVATFTKGATDSDGSVYRLFRDLNPDIKPLALLVANDANAAFTAATFGVHRTGVGGAAVNASVLATGFSAAAARASWLPGVGFNALGALAHTLVGTKFLYELVGHTSANKLPAYDITMTATTSGGTASAVTAVLLFTEE